MAYRPEEIEPKWQNYWEENHTFKTPDDFQKPKYYILDMFPYPSGSGLHVGHPEGYTATDILARTKRMQGFNVLHPMGWDAFGLPAEKHALKTKTHPEASNRKNIDNFRKQLKMLGFSYDWKREINTTDPSYYRWTQWIFLQLYKKGLAYPSDAPVNWCEELKTVLANEEVQDHVDQGYTVVKRPMRQWMLKITAYAQKLLDGLDDLDWPVHLKEMQRNWIGRSEGCTAFFALDGLTESLDIYTTRPDTMFGASFMVIAPEHPLVDKITKPAHKQDVDLYRRQASLKSDLERTELQKEKSGVFTGGYAINPLTGKKIPVWISDYVLISYGSGAIMAVPANDDRDYEFATKFGLEIVEILEGGELPKGAIVQRVGGTIINSQNSELNLNGLNVSEAIEKTILWLETAGLGKRTIQYKLRDWLFSRQRYWGEPIPILYTEQGEQIAIDEADLPLVLPDVESYEPSGTGESPLATIDSWVNYTYKGIRGKLETNTMPQWAGSCWYYLRFISPDCQHRFVDEEAEKYWMNVDLYLGGAEHAVLHLIYARFWHKVLYDLGLVSTSEPFKKLFNQGMILGEDGQKMSKSLGNVINPDDIVARFGADSFRLYEMFMGPLDRVKNWNTDNITGLSKFLRRIWSLVEDDHGNAVTFCSQDSLETLRVLHRTIRDVTADIDRLYFNTAIAKMMECLNEFKKQEALSKSSVETLLILLSGFAPHICEELWQKLGHSSSISQCIWPVANEEYLIENMVTLVIQINGKVRDQIQITPGLNQEECLKMARASEKVQKYLEGKEPVKVILVPDKLLNLVVK
ncbi:MAG: leucine--tRNA ligase [Candidatus Cloacimonetes bacterium]|nr:leucine--tRNA ligase [Candidatus Cloacimonadota bacterium]